MSEYNLPGLKPGNRWCVTTRAWLRAYEEGVSAFVVLASTHGRALEVVPLGVPKEHAVDDVPGLIGT